MGLDESSMLEWEPEFGPLTLGTSTRSPRSIQPGLVLSNIEFILDDCTLNWTWPVRK
ncbi:hypothetical protein CABS01_15137 [Colletotrichum abscissum]|uniref:uncharacterized protein n=1 Tax=Colletotrichum abscissum TaxID=1671311 RepID=UPI0027D6EE5A|nr:uncharacterized protein CABS01_15137 [Colletotrichum abscissum]KAK1477096.1 hypothetical protein CABS01_15137 [Colletotrichum abscissum]